MHLIRWVLLVTLGEAIGFSVPAALFAVTAASSTPLATYVALVLGGIGGRGHAWSGPS
jgi:hypothetical protein